MAGTKHSCVPARVQLDKGRVDVTARDSGGEQLLSIERPVVNSSCCQQPAVHPKGLASDWGSQ
jgi:hypothetical protein